MGPGFDTKGLSGFSMHADNENTAVSINYTGKDLENDLGLYYFGARWVDPVAGIFLSVDPAKPEYEDPLSLNPYLFSPRDKLDSDT
jgi:RHS repeat-associated protein